MKKREKEFIKGLKCLVLGRTFERQQEVENQIDELAKEVLK